MKKRKQFANKNPNRASPTTFPQKNIVSIIDKDNVKTHHFNHFAFYFNGQTKQEEEINVVDGAGIHFLDVIIHLRKIDL